MPRPQSDFLTAHVRQPAPDLYGPLWVCVTLVLAIGVMANVADYLQSGGQTGRWRYDFRKVSISATAVFGYALLVPLLLWLLLLYWRRRHGQDVQLGFVEIVCLYGYSLAVYIPVSVRSTTALAKPVWRNQSWNPRQACYFSWTLSTVDEDVVGERRCCGRFRWRGCSGRW